MNKLFTKIATAFVGIAMAIGVGVAVGSNGESTKVHAEATTRLTLNTASTTIATSNSYGNYGETSTAYQWAVTCGSKQSAGLWLGSNSGQKSKMNLGNGSYSDASGIATAIGVQTSATYYAAIIQRASTIAKVDTVTLTYTTPGGTAPSEAWILYNDGTNGWTVFQKVTSLSSSGTTFSHSQVASARYAFVIHSTAYCQFKVPVLTFKGTDSTVPVSGVTVSPTQTSIVVGGTQQLTPTISPSDATNKNVTYSSSDDNVATVNSTGLITAVSAGDATITVKTVDGNHTATCAVTVTAPVAVSSVTLNKESTTIDAGNTETLTATVLPENASNKNVTWSSSDETVATVDQSGVVTGVGGGTVTITVESQADSSKKDTCEVTVAAPTTATITYSDVIGKGTQGGGDELVYTKAMATLNVSSGYGNTSYFHVYKNATMTISSTLTFVRVELTDAGDSSYSLSGFASIEGYTNGVWTGESKSITFTASNKQVRMAQIKVFYKTNAPSVDITTGQHYLIEGGASASFSATITNDNNYTITWSATPSTGVTISPATSVSGGDVSISFDGTTPGTTPIAIKATLNNQQQTYSENYNVYSFAHAGTAEDPFPATEANIFCNPSYAAQAGGDWYVCGYVVGEIADNKGYYIDEDPTATTEPYKFEVYNTNGVVNQTGKTITVGQSYIVAHGGMKYYSSGSQAEIENSIVTSVDNGAVPSIGIDGGDRIVDINDSVTLTVTKEYDEGATVSWSSSDEDVATVDGGELTLKASGSTQITASMTVKGVVYSSTITVTVIKEAFDIGDEIYFYAEHASTTYYMCSVGGSGSSSETEADKISFTVVQGYESGTVAFKHGNEYLKRVSSSPYLGSGDTIDATTSWVAVDEGNNIKITSCDESGRMLLWNYNNGTPRFGCYTSTSDTILYVLAGSAVKPTTVSLTQHAITLENGSSTTLEYTSDVPGTFMWTSSNEDIATVTSGTVECLADAGNTTIRIFYDTNGNGVYDNGEPTDTCVVTAVPAQIHFGDANYGGIGTLIESDSSLNGKKVIIGRNAVPVVAGSLAGSYFGAVTNDTEGVGGISYDSSTKKMTVGNGLTDTKVTVFTITSVNDKYTLSTVVEGETKYLCESTAKKVTLDTESQTWAITISEGVATITSTNGNALQYNASSPRFTTYTSGQSSIELYEYKSYYDEATEYADFFVGGETGTCSETITDWSDLGEIFGGLTTGAQNIYSIATHEDPSSYSHEKTVEHAVARYDDAIRKHPELRSNEFMHRFGEGKINGNLAPHIGIMISKNTVNTSIIVIVTVGIAAIAIGGYFLLRKKKED